MKGSHRYQEINLINHIERISNKSAKSILNLEKLEDINKEITILADYLNMTRSMDDDSSPVLPDFSSHIDFHFRFELIEPHESFRHTYIESIIELTQSNKTPLEYQ